MIPRYRQTLRQLRIYLVALAVMAGIWGASLATQAQVAYGNDTAVWVLGSSVGEVWICRWLSTPGVSVRDGFHFDIRLPDPENQTIKMLPGIHALGFFAHHSGRGSTIGWGSVVIIPYWAIGVAVLCGIGWLRHRAARRRLPRQGFPVS